MTFFLSCESQAPGAGLLMQYHNLTQPLLNTLSNRDYGPELTEISIITIFLSDELLKDGGYPERRLFLRKERAADLRLRLNYRQFLTATPNARVELYCSHILDSIDALRKKVSRDFRFHDLVRDVKALLDHPEFQSELTAIHRFP